MGYSSVSVDSLRSFVACCIVCMLTFYAVHSVQCPLCPRANPSSTRKDAVNRRCGQRKSDLCRSLFTSARIKYGLQGLFLARTTEKGNRRLCSWGFELKDKLHGA